MTSFNRFFIFFFFVTLAIFIQRGGFLNIHGIVPNLLLMLFIALIIEGERIGMIVPLVCAMLFSALLIDSFWIIEFGVLGLVIFLFVIARKRFTGNVLADFLLMTLVGEILWYGLLALLGSSVFSITTIAYEFAYTIAMGIPLRFIGKRYLK